MVFPAWQDGKKGWIRVIYLDCMLILAAQALAVRDRLFDYVSRGYIVGSWPAKLLYEVLLTMAPSPQWVPLLSRYAEQLCCQVSHTSREGHGS